MLEMLDKALLALPAMMDQPDQWSTLVINRRKPFTYRAFFMLGDLRVCLHRFETCDEQEAFLHPHPWPGAFLIVKGSYLMQVGYSSSRTTKPESVGKILMVPGSRYEIVNPLTWHSVIPQEECYTMMVNGPAWPADYAHTEVRTTKGKDLDKMSHEDTQSMFKVYREFLK